jgi:hypothetical protein
MPRTVNGLPPQGKKDAYQRIESILESAGKAGIHRAHFLYELHWSQVGARVKEMNDAGWFIESVPLPPEQQIHGIRTKYVLRSKPLTPEQDWYECATGRKRGEPVQLKSASDLPLFSGGGQ